jgi:RNA polymerase sigma factor (sigma-70 family)
VITAETFDSDAHLHQRIRSRLSWLLRPKKANPLAILETDYCGDDEELRLDAPAPQPAPEARAEQEDLSGKVWNIVKEELTARELQVAELWYREGCDGPHIAEILEMDKATVRSALRNLKKKLRKSEWLCTFVGSALQ